MGPQIFKDKNGRPIREGDTLFREIYARQRERPGHKRVAIQSMGDREVIVPDEGVLLPASPQWITRKVVWHGASMCADRDEYSDFQLLMSSSLFDRDGEQIFESSASMTMNNCFKGEDYTIIS